MILNKSNVVFFHEALKEKELKFYVITLSNCYHCQYINRTFVCSNKSFNSEDLLQGMISGLVKDLLIEGSVDYNKRKDQIEYNNYISNLTTNDLIKSMRISFEQYLQTNKYTSLLVESDDPAPLTQSLIKRISANAVKAVASNIIDELYEQALINLQKIGNGYDIHVRFENNIENIEQAMQICASNSLLTNVLQKLQSGSQSSETQLNKLAIMYAFESVKSTVARLTNLANEASADLIIRK